MTAPARSPPEGGQEGACRKAAAKKTAAKTARRARPPPRRRPHARRPRARRSRRRRRRRRPWRRRPLRKKAPAKKATTRATAAKKAPARKTAAKKAPAKKATTRTAAKKAPAKRKTAAKKTAATKTAARKASAAEDCGQEGTAAKKTAARKTARPQDGCTQGSRQARALTHPRPDSRRGWSRIESPVHRSTSPPCARSWRCPAISRPRCSPMRHEPRGDASSCPTTTRPTSPWSRSIRPAAATSTRPCTSRATVPGTSSATRSPTSRAFVRRDQRSTTRLAARRDALLPRRSRTAAPAGAERGCGQPAARRGAPRRAVAHQRSTTRGRRARRRPTRTVRSRAQYDYATVHASWSTRGDDDVATLARRGRPRSAGRARARHAINLDLPEQQVERRRRDVAARRPRTARCRGVQRRDLAADRHVRRATDARRTAAASCARCPTPRARGAARSARAPHAAASHWPHGADPGDVLASLDRSDPRHVALLEHAASLLRGAAYTRLRRRRAGADPSMPVSARRTPR